MSAERTYHKSHIIPSDQGTWVYWTTKNGISLDISHRCIPEGATVIDETHNVGKTHE